MKTWSLRAAALSLSTALACAVAGCGDESQPMVTSAPTPPPGGAPAGGGGAPAQTPPPSNPKIKELMGKLAKGPISLTPTIGKGLEGDKPDWAALEPKTKEYAKLVGEMAKEEPPKGSKESWATLTAAYLKNAEALDKAVTAKNLEDAKAAHGAIAGSCMACHREHRPQPSGGPGGPRPGGPGGPGAGGPPPEGGPAGRYQPAVPSDYPGREAKEKSAPAEPAKADAAKTAESKKDEAAPAKPSESGAAPKK